MTAAHVWPTTVAVAACEWSNAPLLSRRRMLTKSCCGVNRVAAEKATGARRHVDVTSGVRTGVKSQLIMTHPRFSCLPSFEPPLCSALERSLDVGTELYLFRTQASTSD